jgi:hypothetical protein
MLGEREEGHGSQLFLSTQKLEWTQCFVKVAKSNFFQGEDGDWVKL